MKYQYSNLLKQSIIFIVILLISVCTVSFTQEQTDQQEQSQPKALTGNSGVSGDQNQATNANFWYIFVSVDKYEYTDAPVTNDTPAKNMVSKLSDCLVDIFKIDRDTHIRIINDPIRTTVFNFFKIPEQENPPTPIQDFLSSIQADDTIVICIVGRGGIFDKTDILFPSDYVIDTPQTAIAKNMYYIWIQSALQDLQKKRLEISEQKTVKTLNKVKVVMIFNVDRNHVKVQIGTKFPSPPNNFRYTEIGLPESDSTTPSSEQFGTSLIAALKDKKTVVKDAVEYLKKSNISPILKGSLDIKIAPSSIYIPPPPPIHDKPVPLPETPVTFTPYIDKAPEKDFISDIPASSLVADFDRVFIGGGLDGSLQIIDKDADKQFRITPPSVSGVVSIAVSEKDFWWLTEHPKRLFHYAYGDDITKGELTSADVSKITNIRDVDRIGYSDDLLGLFSFNSTTLIDVKDSEKKPGNQLQQITKGVNSYLLSSSRNDTFLVTVSGKELLTYRHDASQAADQTSGNSSTDTPDQNVEWQLIPSMQPSTSTTIRQVSQNTAGLGVFTDGDVSAISIRDMGPAVLADRSFDIVTRGKIVEGAIYGDRDVWLITSRGIGFSEKGNKLFHMDLDDGKVTDETAFIGMAFKSRNKPTVTINRSQTPTKQHKLSNANVTHPGIRHVAAVKTGCYVSTDEGVVFISLPEYRKILEMQ